MRIKDVIDVLEETAPLKLQESYDNSGLQLGDTSVSVERVLVCLDVTEAVVREAIEKKCELIVSHHPVFFTPLKSINPGNTSGRIAVAAIKNGIAVYSAHTNLDNVRTGVNHELCARLGLMNTEILLPHKNLCKLVTYVPLNNADKVANALWQTGAGQIGNYSKASFRTSGSGTFMGNEASNPVVGEKGKLETVDEQKLEVIFEAHREGEVLAALRASHPYEEVAYEVYKTENNNPEAGSGMLGELSAEMSEEQFLKLVKKSLDCRGLRHTERLNQPIKKVAVCGGSGSFLLQSAIRAGAQAFVTADIKYHQFFDADGRLLLIDAGHYETEQYTNHRIQRILLEKIPTIAVLLTEHNTNPVKYL